METILIKALQLIAALALLVIIHEFGHYFFARLFGIRVEKFYLFFNPWFSICKWKPKEKPRKYKKDGTPKTSWRDTTYGIGWIPLGGYCKIAGMIDESMDKEQMEQPAKPDEFRSRPAWQRLFVMIGGVLFNFILAIVIYIGIAVYYGNDELPYGNIELGMNFTEEAQSAGYRNGDIILRADTTDMTTANAFNALPVASASVVTVLRGNDTVRITNPEDFPVKLPNGLFVKGNQVLFPAIVGKAVSGSGAEKAGMTLGDKIIAIDGKPIIAFQDIKPYLSSVADGIKPVTIVRENDTISVNANIENHALGVIPLDPTLIYNVKHTDYGFFEAIPFGISRGCDRMVSYVSSLKYLFTKEGAQSVGGFGAIADLFPAKWDWLTFWELCAFLSIILAFMNILPIPALDGGHVLFVLWEMITRRKPSDKFLERAQMVGMFLLLALLLYANGNDIYRMIFK